MKSKKSSNKRNRNPIVNLYFYFILGFCLVAFTILGVNIKINLDNENATIETETPNVIYSSEEKPAMIDGAQGEVTEVEVPTVEEVDGGRFKDKDTGVSVTEGEYQDLGWSETYNVSSPEAFKNDTLNKCIIANNYFGAQCVSLARVYWWSYANRDVSTCGTGMAQGMMNCADENAGDDFLIYWSEDKDQIQAGDWLVFTGGKYGHIGMALGPVVNGYVALLGENQGGLACVGFGGAATNIININIKNLIGFYRPKSYQKTPVTPDTPATPTDNCKIRTVKNGDTLGDIMKECTGEVKWGAEMNEYAKHWYSTNLKVYNTVYDGWVSTGGYGLFTGDVIEWR